MRQRPLQRGNALRIRLGQSALAGDPGHERRHARCQPALLLALLLRHAARDVPLVDGEAGAQIDGAANINLVQADGRRFPGSFGSAYLYPVVPRVILFREEHSRRTLVPKVEFISAAGNPQALLTGKALFSWRKDRRRFRLESVHPGFGVEEIVKETGFEFDLDSPRTTEEPSKQELSLLRGPVAKAIQAGRGRMPRAAARGWRPPRARTASRTCHSPCICRNGRSGSASAAP